MVPAVDACPSEDALLACLEAQRISELAEHLDACDQCREVVAVLGRGSSEPLPALGEVPARIGRFVIEQRLGAGAMGVVYLAHDPRLERRVALKVLRDDMPAAELLIEEARAMARIEHDNLAVVYEVEQVGDRVAIAMEHLPGGTLRAWLKTRRTWRETVSVMAGVARGLAAIHAAGIAHRDLKPDNILFDLTGRPRIADFGLATQPTTTTTTSVIGTPAYMAPEQLAGAPADAASDQWSFFVCLFEALTGSRPFRGSTPAELRAHMLATRAPRVVGPRKLQALVARGLAVDAGSRHPSMSWVAETLGQMRLSRRAVPALVAFAGISVVAVLMTSTGERDNAAPCDRSRDRIAEAWNAGEAARITAVFGKAGMIDTASIVTRGLERYADAWAVGQRASCEATHVQQVQSETLLDRRTICLEERLAHVEVLVQALSGDDRGVLARAGEAVAMLPPIADCADLAALVRTPRPVTPDPVARERGRQAWLEIARVHALASLHDVSVRTRVEPILATATALRDHALDPAELFDADGDRLGERGHEFGTVTGRKRRCGWFDAVLVRQTCATSGVTGIALTKLDVLDGFDTLKICVGYELDGVRLDYLPTAADQQARCTPIYEEMEGWQDNTAGARSWAQLPGAAIKYVRRIEELIACPVALLSTSPERDDTILVTDPFVD